MVFVMRKFFSEQARRAERGVQGSGPGTENPSAFMAASMQGCDSATARAGKGTGSLHRIERERAEQTRRLSEKRSGPGHAGGAAGGKRHWNHLQLESRAEQVLGIRGLAFRRYSEALGASSGNEQADWGNASRTGQFSDAKSRTRPPAGDTRHLGVTISPIRRGRGKISGRDLFAYGFDGALPHCSTHATEGKLGRARELSAGIAHEFKNALATDFRLRADDPVGVQRGRSFGLTLNASWSRPRNITHVVRSS